LHLQDFLLPEGELRGNQRSVAMNTTMEPGAIQYLSALIGLRPESTHDR
jgi:hypothetical protein